MATEPTPEQLALMALEMAVDEAASEASDHMDSWETADFLAALNERGYRVVKIEGQPQ